MSDAHKGKVHSIFKVTSKSKGDLGEWMETVSDDTYEIVSNHKPRNWQIDCFVQLKDEQFGIINAPMGTGKSTMISYLTCHKLKKHDSLKALIVVPQTIIASGFMHSVLLSLPDGSQVEWKPGLFLCDPEQSVASKTESLAEWLKLKAHKKTPMSQRIAVVCSQTYVKTFANMSKDMNYELNRNLLTVFDEAHHINAEQTPETSNQLGRCVMGHVLRASANNHVLLVTATFFRNMNQSVLPADVIDKHFEMYKLPFDVYFNSMMHFRNFNYEFSLFERNYVDNVVKGIHDLNAEKIASKKETAKIVVYLPSVNGKVAENNTDDDGNKISKYDVVTQIIDKMKESIGITNHFIDPEGVIHLTDLDESQVVWIAEEDEQGKPTRSLHLQNAKVDCKILDLVTEGVSGYNNVNREFRKRYLQTTSRRKSCFDIIITLNMVKEGMDIPFADSEIIIGAKGSLNDIVQILGRMFRDERDWQSNKAKFLLQKFAAKYGRMPNDRPWGQRLKTDVVNEYDLVHHLKKDNVRVIHLLQHVVGSRSDEEMRENFSEFFKGITFALLMESIVNPIFLEETTPHGVIRTNPFDKLDIEPDTRQIIFEAVQQAILANESRAGTDDYIDPETHIDDLYEKLDSVVKEVLPEPIQTKVSPEDLRSLVRITLATLARNHRARTEEDSSPSDGTTLFTDDAIDISDIDFDKVVLTDSVLWVKHFAAIKIGKEDLSELRILIRSRDEIDLPMFIRKIRQIMGKEPIEESATKPKKKEKPSVKRKK